MFGLSRKKPRESNRTKLVVSFEIKDNKDPLNMHKFIDEGGTWNQQILVFTQ